MLLFTNPQFVAQCLCRSSEAPGGSTLGSLGSCLRPRTLRPSPRSNSDGHHFSRVWQQQVELCRGNTKVYGSLRCLTDYLVWPAAASELAAGIALLAGWHSSDVGFALAGCCILVASLFYHDFEDQDQSIRFMEDIVMAGGFLVLADHSKTSGAVPDSIAEPSLGAPHWIVELRFRSAGDAEEQLPEYRQ